MCYCPPFSPHGQVISPAYLPYFITKQWHQRKGNIFNKRFWTFRNNVELNHSRCFQRSHATMNSLSISMWGIFGACLVNNLKQINVKGYMENPRLGKFINILTHTPQMAEKTFQYMFCTVTNKAVSIWNRWSRWPPYKHGHAANRSSSGLFYNDAKSPLILSK